MVPATHAAEPLWSQMNENSIYLPWVQLLQHIRQGQPGLHLPNLKFQVHSTPTTKLHTQ